MRLFRRTLAVLERGRGKTIAEIARMLGMNRRSIHRWIEAYRETVDPDSLLDEKRSGRPRRWTEECSQWLQALLARYPTEFGYYAMNWNVPLLRDPLTRCTAERFSDHTIRRALLRLGYTWKRARYVLQVDPEQEKKTPNSPGNPLFAIAQRRIGGGRNRLAAVPSAAGELGPARRAEPRFAFGPECSPRHFRGAESPHRKPCDDAASASEAGRFPSVFDRLAPLLSRLADYTLVGRRSEPYRQPFATPCERLRYPAPLVAEAFTRVESPGPPLGTRQGCRQREHAISDD